MSEALCTPRDENEDARGGRRLGAGSWWAVPQLLETHTGRLNWDDDSIDVFAAPGGFVLVDRQPPKRGRRRTKLTG